MTQTGDTGTLVLRVCDEATGTPIQARCRFASETGSPTSISVAGQSPLGVPGKTFLIPGETTVRVSTGELLLTVERGLEYCPAEVRIAVPAGKTVQQMVALRRWVHMAGRGWYSGDMHMHVPADRVPAHLLAEDLNVGTSLASWVTAEDSERVSPVVDHVRRVDSHHCYSVNDQEVERFPIDRYGAPVYLVNLRQQVHLDAPTPAWPLNLEYERRARASGAAVCAHSAVFDDVAVAAAHGTLDTVGVACNFFGYALSLDRVAMYGNDDDLALYGSGAEGTYQMTLGKYYRLLNCGFRLPVSAGSAAGVKPNPVGHNRAYVHLGDGALSYEQYFGGLRRGRSFATNGPMLFLAADGAAPGDTVALTEGRPLQVRVEGHWHRPLASVQLLFNGRVVGEACPSGESGAAVLETTFRPSSSGWLAACARGCGPLIRFAHTSPVYVSWPDRPQDCSGDARYFAKWIRHRIGQLPADPEFLRDEHRAQVAAELSSALAVYERLAATTPARRPVSGSMHTIIPS